MSGIDRDRFGLGGARPRPAHEPRAIRCPSCGSPNAVKDDQAKLVVCGHCATHLELSADEAVVLGESRVKRWAFPLELGDRFQFKGVASEVIARMAHIEDGDETEVTRDYLLYHPTRGSLWLSEYGGKWSWSRPTHVMPAGSVGGLNATDRMETGDGRRWVVAETGEYELRYVDGSLPWVARVGDRVRYLECEVEGGGEEQYEVTWEGQQREFGAGASLPVSAVRRALGRQDVFGVEKSTSMAAKVHAAKRVLVMAAVAALINVAALAYCWFSGSQVLTETFTPDQLTEGAFTSSFELPGRGSLLKVKLEASGLSNAWMAVNLAVVEGEETVAHILDADISYYHGSSGGESWSEGSRRKSKYIKVSKGGSYRLLIQGVSGVGNDASADEARHAVRVTVMKGASLYHFFIVSTILCAVVFLLAMQGHTKLAGGDDDDD